MKDFDNKAALAAVGFAGGVALLAAGDICLSVGIPLQIIGKKRLNWIADEYNHSNYSADIRFGAGQYGTGVVLSL